MSMIFNLVRIPGSLGEELLRNPRGIHAIIYPGQESPDAAVSEADTAGLDKAWHALHFLFTGTDWAGGFPEAFLVFGGTEVGDVDVGYGPARFFDASYTSQIDAYLQSLNEAALKGNFDPEKMEKLSIYPEIWGEENEEELWEYVVEHFRTMKGFVREAATEGKALLVYCS